MSAPDPGRLLTVVYDLSVGPTSFDCATFLTLAEMHRRSSGCGAMQVVFVPADGAGFWDRENIEVAEKLARLEKLLVPLCSLWPSCTRVVVLDARSRIEELAAAAGRDVFPVGYRPEAPAPDNFQWAHIVAAHACGETIPDWQVPTGAREAVEHWLAPRVAGRRVITVTLREAAYHAGQNSNLAAWGDFARSLDPTSYFPVLLRDTACAHAPSPEPLAGLATFPEASIDVTVRAALYLRSYLCLSGPTGPMMLIWLNAQCRSLVFGLHRPGLFRSAPVPLRSMGLDIGRPLPVPGLYHRLVWAPDTGAEIARAWADMVAFIDSKPDQIVALTAREADSPHRLARRLRLSGRDLPAQRIYAHLRHARQSPVSAAAAQSGLALIEEGRVGALRRMLWRPMVPLPRSAFDPNLDQDPDALLDLAEWRVRLGRTDRARAICAAILARHDDCAEAFCLLGEIELRAGRLAEAVARLAAAATGDPWSAVAQYQYGVALLLLGRDREACAAFHAAALNDPSHEAARQKLAALSCSQTLPPDFSYEAALARRGGDPGRSIGEIAYAVTLSKGQGDCRAIYVRGRLWGMPDRAGGVLGAHWRSGTAYWRVPRFGAASRWLGEAAIRVSPLLPFGAALERLSAIVLYRREEPAWCVAATGIAELDRMFAQAKISRGSSPASG